MELIIEFNADETIIAPGSRNLQRRRGGPGACPIVSVECASGRYASPLPQVEEAETIFLRGHGNWQTCTLGDWSPDDVFQLLVRNNIQHGWHRLISVTGCNCARSRAAGEPESMNDKALRTIKDEAVALLHTAGDSFAGRLHAALHARGIDIPVTGRAYRVDVEASGRKKVVTGPGTTKKAGSDGTGRFTKIVFFSKAGVATRSWVKAHASASERDYLSRE